MKAVNEIPVPLFRPLSSPDDLADRHREVNESLVSTVASIVGSVKNGGDRALLEYARALDGLSDDACLYYDRDSLGRALEGLPSSDRKRLFRTAGRIRTFAEAQRKSVMDIDVSVPGGRAGHRIRPVETSGCYVPGGRYPLPSSVLMTVVPARVAGVTSVWVASPRPAPITLAAAGAAGADGLLAAGGAQAIAALAFGTSVIPPSDVVVGPGNSYVTEAKRQISGSVRIDMLAGPSELVIIADETASPELIAADLLAQAEHDPQSLPVLITLSPLLAERVGKALKTQIDSLPSEKTARVALSNGGYMLAEDINQASKWCDVLSPEHVQLCVRDAPEIERSLRHFGSVFIGERSAEVLGDYGAGPNHVLPTEGTARSVSGLSVFTFLRFQTWLRMENDDDDARQLLDDTSWLARKEGLEGHARASEMRLP
jgi:histidinol dehydrogenase